jgi:hypothetical protein
MRLVLQARIEERKWCGVWRAGASYRAGNECTHEGAKWHCNTDTQCRRGTDAAPGRCVQRAIRRRGKQLRIAVVPDDDG